MGFEKRQQTEDRRPKTEEKYFAPYGALLSRVAIKDGLLPSPNHYSAYGLILPGSQPQSLWDAMILSRRQFVLQKSSRSIIPVGAP